jgi:hypothetical protein
MFPFLRNRLLLLFFMLDICVDLTNGSRHLPAISTGTLAVRITRIRRVPIGTTLIACPILILIHTLRVDLINHRLQIDLVFVASCRQHGVLLLRSFFRNVSLVNSFLPNESALAIPVRLSVAALSTACLQLDVVVPRTDNFLVFDLAFLLV